MASSTTASKILSWMSSLLPLFPVFDVICLFSTVHCLASRFCLLGRLLWKNAEGGWSGLQRNWEEFSKGQPIRFVVLQKANLENRDYKSKVHAFHFQVFIMYCFVWAWLMPIQKTFCKGCNSAYELESGQLKSKSNILVPIVFLISALTIKTLHSSWVCWYTACKSGECDPKLKAYFYLILNKP